jgi:hypothetical protein
MVAIRLARVLIDSPKAPKALDLLTLWRYIGSLS